MEIQNTTPTPEYNIRKKFSKRYKLEDSEPAMGIEVAIIIKTYAVGVRRRKVVVSRYNIETNEITATKEFNSEYLDDILAIEKYLVKLKLKKHLTRCMTWITNNLDFKMG